MIPGSHRAQQKETRGPVGPDPRTRGAARRRASRRSRPPPTWRRLEALDLDILGKKGRLTAVLRGIGALPADDRPRVGAIANAVRGDIEAALAERGTDLRGSALTGTPGGRDRRRHDARPRRSAAAASTRASSRWARSPRSSASSGSSSYESPEIEDDLTNFQMLNIPPDHPARDLWDTLYVDVEGRLLRTHTSPGQIRAMQTDEAADPGAAARSLLPLRGDRRVARLGVLPGRGPDGRRGHHDGRPQGPPRPVRQGDVRRGQEDPLPARLLPVHRAVRRVRRRVPRLRRLGLPGLRPDAAG